MPATTDIHAAVTNGAPETGKTEPVEQKDTEKNPGHAQFSLFCDERGYLSQIDYILQTGVRKGDRTGTGVISVFGMQARYSLRGE